MRRVQPLLSAVPADGDVADQLFELIEADDAPSAASFLHREASRDQMLDFLRERSVQQLKESDPQSFALPRIDGPAKVALAELQYDEYGGGRPERLHSTMYADALTAAGLDSGYGAYIDEVSAALAGSGQRDVPVRAEQEAPRRGDGPSGRLRGDELGPVPEDRARHREDRAARRGGGVLP